MYKKNLFWLHRATIVPPALQKRERFQEIKFFSSGPLDGAKSLTTISLPGPHCYYNQAKSETNNGKHTIMKPRLNKSQSKQYILSR